MRVGHDSLVPVFRAVFFLQETRGVVLPTIYFFTRDLRRRVACDVFFTGEPQCRLGK